MRLPQVLHARYTDVEPLARGGFGVVLKARDRELGRLAAIKLLAPGEEQRQVGWEKIQARFTREAQLVARIQHPNVVQVYDSGMEGELLFIVYEFVPGQDLFRTLRGYPRGLPLKEALEIGRQLLAGLAAAHEIGVVHRDMKPGNVLLTPDNEVKLTDFGLARDEGEESDLTRQGALLGTPWYAPLEVYLGQKNSRSGDVYAAGLILYQVLCGEMPFTARTPEELYRQKQTLESAELPPNRPFPQWVRNLIRSMTARTQGERPGDAVEALGSWEEALDRAPPPPPTPRARIRPPGPAPAPTSTEEETGWVTRGGVVKWIVIFLVLEVAVYLAFFR